MYLVVFLLIICYKINTQLLGYNICLRHTLNHFGKSYFNIRNRSVSANFTKNFISIYNFIFLVISNFYIGYMFECVPVKLIP